jgi:hypothetical protein
VSPPIWLDTTGRPRPTRACWTGGHYRPGSWASNSSESGPVERRYGRIIPLLFPCLSGRRGAGQRRRDFGKAWAKPVRRLRSLGGCGMTSAGRRSGTRTRSVFDRYHIVSPADLRAASCRLAEADGHVRTGGLDGQPVTTENA